MATALHIIGPDFSAIHPLDPTGAETIIGRDPNCHVVLPDPKRNVSRRHLAVWMQGNRLFFRVISSVAGVTTSLRKYGPGESGELQTTHHMRFSGYTLHSEPASDTPSAASPSSRTAIGTKVKPDPWAELDSQWAGQGGPPTMAEFPASSLEQDPFGEWALSQPAAASQTPSSANTGQASSQALIALLSGLGMDPSRRHALSEQDLVSMGKRIRRAVHGIITLEANMEASQAKLGLKHTDPSNPLIGQRSPATKVDFLLGTGPAPSGKLDPDDALDDLLVRLHAHETALMAASKATAMGVLTDLEPNAIKAKFEKPSALLPLQTNGKLWELFTKHHENIGANLPQWLADVMARHFAPFYSREYGKNRK